MSLVQPCFLSQSLVLTFSSRVTTLVKKTDILYQRKHQKVSKLTCSSLNPHSAYLPTHLAWNERQRLLNLSHQFLTEEDGFSCQFLPWDEHRSSY
ncbi:endoribonuclease ysh1 [Histoplasma capsulatum G186AR]|uniref:Endoribonuclease ysh1 n=1 Tax=Ajellomyces capsulatus TaxID=5037 RepID=A0A8H7YCI7_AJECA|nr:endoribonuclease ysh1 [Histoplasma capsulatum]QSS73388.1 endoribonuclease ysh1 [Histoplasma capsulatum G186AR]